MATAKKANRLTVTLACTECKERTYTTQKNMARQASITRELIEIVAGAEALR